VFGLRETMAAVPAARRTGQLASLGVLFYAGVGVSASSMAAAFSTMTYLFRLRVESRSRLAAGRP
jgi:hypothetical protein